MPYPYPYPSPSPSPFPIPCPYPCPCPCPMPYPIPIPLLVRSAHRDHTLACQRSVPISLRNLGLTRTPAERGFPIPIPIAMS